MNDIKIQDYVNKLFSFFINQHPDCDKGEYLCAKTNRILAFDEYISRLWDVQIRMILCSPIQRDDIQNLRQSVHHSVEKYLSDNLKTLALR